MVRLKAKRKLHVRELLPDFNSYMVRLKAIISAYWAALFTYFNSYMVRLKVYVFHIYYLKDEFQFLYGAIKRKNGKKYLNFNLISIPIWCD